MSGGPTSLRTSKRKSTLLDRYKRSILRNRSEVFGGAYIIDTPPKL